MTAPNAPPTSATLQLTAPTGPASPIVASLEGVPSAADHLAKGESPSDAARVLARVRRLMFISSALTLTAILVVLGLVGYRLLRTGEYHQMDLTVTVPKGAKIVQTAVAEDRIVVTLDVGGAIEIRTYDLHTLKPMGRLSFGFAP